MLSMTVRARPVGRAPEIACAMFFSIMALMLTITPQLFRNDPLSIRKCAVRAAVLLDAKSLNLRRQSLISGGTNP
jgi:hypothetical protein